MKRHQALEVKQGDWLHCDFYHPPQCVQVMDIDIETTSQEGVMFYVQAGRHGFQWLDAGWFQPMDSLQGEQVWAALEAEEITMSRAAELLGLPFVEVRELFEQRGKA